MHSVGHVHITLQLRYVRCNRSSDMTRDVISDMASHVSCNQMRVINITFVGV